ncbi:MAG: C10 family peptidase [Bacteroidetes bacterium]|nr:C10 family peptidase [Bacteroidota bacterium]
MKRFVTTILLALSFLSLLHAAPVDQQRARTVAVNWMMTRGGSEYSTISVSDVYPFSREGVVTHYIMNLQPDGFVFVAGDDIAAPVLMYGAHGRYDGMTLPPALAEMLDLYAGDLVKDVRNGLSQPSAIAGLWQELSQEGTAQRGFFKGGGNSIASVSPLLTATWNQTTPYNLDCPAVTSGGSGGHVYVGCVATAMAMIMHYHGHPSTGVGSHSYTHPTYGLQSADFGNTTYNWAAMPNSVSTSSSTAAKAAIAQLSYHCGVSVDMNYSPSGSGANTSDARDAFVNNFRYKSSAQYRSRSSYGTTTWTSLLVDELDHSRPVMYRGSEQNGSGGHAFIVDGYNGTDYFHFNFGWGGYLNGYCYLNDITPGSNEFSYWQGMITGIEPLANVAPTLAAPANQATEQCVTPSLSWNAVQGAISYRLQVSTSAAFSSTLYDNASLTSTSVSIPSLAPGVRHYWRVNVTSGAGTSPWSTAWSFYTREVTITPSSPTTFCEGGSVQLVGSTGTGVTYVWSRNSVPIASATQSTYTATQSGNYTLAILDNGCATYSDPVTVNVTPLPIAEITSPNSANICQGQSITLSATQAGGYTYQWRLDGTDLPGATGPVLSVANSGLYDVVVTSAGCVSTSTPVTIAVYPADPDAFVWTGAVSSEWSTNGNWDSPCALPGSGDNVTIPGNVTPPSSIPSLTLNNLTVNHPAGIALGGSLVIDGVLNLQSGSISLGDHDLVISASGSITGVGTARHIITNGNGVLRQLGIGSSGRTGAVLYPVGAMAGSYTPVTLANSAASNSFGVRVKAHVLSNGSFGTQVAAGVVDRTWVITAGSGQSDVSLMFAWTAAEELSGFNRAQCFVSRNDAGSSWDALQTPGATQGSGQVSRMISGITTFSQMGLPYAIGSEGTLYPVELINFAASLTDSSVRLDWSTVNEVNNFGFRIQRRGANITDWQDAGFVAADVSSVDLHSYAWIDPTPLPGSSEYRLAQVDLDGTVHYSTVLTVGAHAALPASLSMVYPQPLRSGDNASVTLSAHTDAALRLSLFDMLGREVQTLFEGSMPGGSSRVISLPTAGLRPGVWFLRLAVDNASQLRKFSIIR